MNIDRAAGLRLRDEFVQRGVAVLGPSALPQALHDGLLAEARFQRIHAHWSLVAEDKPGEISQDNVRAYLGVQARSFLSSDTVLALLREVTGRTLRPSWSASCYTYYDGPGQHMGEHCDKRDACNIALLTYLEARWAGSHGPGSGLQLCVFGGDNSSTPLLARVSARANRIVILNGAEQAHLRPPLAAGESLVMLAGCFALSD